MSTWSDRPLLFGHRGARARCPENTLPAFMAAIEDGANAIELDIQVTADGVVVVMHDDDGARMCGVPQLVKQSTWATVSTWDPGLGFVAEDGGRPFARRGLTVPRLEDVLRALPGVPVNVDLKPAEPSCVPAVLSVLERLQMTERVLLTSFHDDVLAAVRSTTWAGRIGFAQADAWALYLLPLAVLKWRRPKGHRLQIPVKAGPLDLGSRGFIDKMHALDIAVDYWVINDAEAGAALLARGADGLMTDVPKKLAPLLTR